MESKYHYFKRDISWLSFNHRVLLEADDDSLPLYERINFVSIYSSNLEEFYKIRVAEHKAIASGGHSDDITQEEAKHLIHQITEVVNEQMEDRIRIYERKLIPACLLYTSDIFASRNLTLQVGDRVMVVGAQDLSLIHILVSTRG